VQAVSDLVTACETFDTGLAEARPIRGNDGESETCALLRTEFDVQSNLRKCCTGDRSSLRMEWSGATGVGDVVLLRVAVSNP
jgi:hypothetical protein